LIEADDFGMATPVLRCDGAALNGFLEDRRGGRVGGTTAVFGGNNKALYFSKEVIPFVADTFQADDLTPVYHHVGVYAYRPTALSEYATWPAGPLEQLEGLEQLRFMENDSAILCVEVDGKGRAFWELNNPEDVPKIEGILKDINQA
ncbi:MAG: cytidylyltransferase domain-containing protein, partial [Planktomarina sp.]